MKRFILAIKQLVPYLKPYRFHIIIVVLSAATVVGMGLVSPWLVRELVSRMSDGGGLTQSVIALYGGIMLGAFLLQAVGRYLQAYIAHIMAWNIVSDIQADVYQHLQTLSPAFYANRQTGELLSRVTGDTNDIEPMIAHSIPDLIVNSLMILGVCIVLLVMNWKLAVLVLLPLPVLIMVVRHFATAEREQFRRALRSLGEFRAKVHDNFSGMKEIQIFVREPAESEAVRQLAKKATDERLVALRHQALVPTAVELTAGIGVVLIVWFGGIMTMNGTMSIANQVAFILYLGMLYQPIRVLAYMNEGLQLAMAGLQSVAEMMALMPEVDDPSDGIDPERVKGHVSFDNIYFSYRNAVPVIENISIDVEAGQTMALVGPTGAGKTTLTALVARFYDPNAGSLKIDHIDAREYRLKALRRSVSMVLQDVFLFNGTIKDNIRFSKPNASHTEIIEAAKMARAHEFILQLSEGYDTQVGERGVRLSGGQKQRLSIARALLKNAPILILDEATSSVDTQTEAEIQEALEHLMKGRTSIVIAHRLSTVRNADKIVVLQDGHVVQTGTHETLMQKKGLYHDLYERQFADDNVHFLRTE
ncbi:MAG TPA: ABC transporter ATP-binding protein [Aggregatilineales bacterium]|nr:ABC transporter ATP-binding protein [Aggregatilineales bacterium]